jgi:ATP-dependent RNA helicase DeaD
MSAPRSPVPGFLNLQLVARLPTALYELGHETPAQSRPGPFPACWRAGPRRDTATDTRRDAAFALPLLARLDVGCQQARVLVLAATRELAIQVAEAFQRGKYSQENIPLVEILLYLRVFRVPDRSAPSAT